jgi:hypothetical protein
VRSGTVKQIQHPLTFINVHEMKIHEHP